MNRLLTRALKICRIAHKDVPETAPINGAFFWFTFAQTGIPLVLIPAWIATHGIVSWGKVFSLTGGFYVFTCLCITAGYHRLWSHAGYKAHPLIQWLWVIGGAGAVQGSVIEWGADHFAHHRHSDTEEDPHDIHHGFWWAHIGWLFFTQPLPDKDIPTRFQKDQLLRWQHRNFLWLALTSGLVLPTLVGGLWYGSWAGVVESFLFAGWFKSFLVSHATYLINSGAHSWGNQVGDTPPRNNFLIALLTLGEGWHANHHAHANDYRNGFRWWQIDPTAWIIKGLSLVGLTTDLKRSGS